MKYAKYNQNDYAPERIHEKALNFITENKDNPFFLYYALNQPHVPRTPNPRFVGKSGMGPRGDVILEADYCVGEIIKTLKEEGVFEGLGSTIQLKNNSFQLSDYKVDQTNLSVFSEQLPPCFKLMIFGAEHDAVQLCQLASYNGWEVTIISGPLESKTIVDFTGATSFNHHNRWSHIHRLY